MTDDETLEFILSLPAAQGYTPKDRYRDFRLVFTQSDEGKRVLRELLSWGHLFRPSITKPPIDPYLTHVREGESNFARKLLTVVTIEPPEPVKATRKKR